MAGAGVLRFNVRPVRRDDTASAMITIEDITQQKVAEEARNSFVALLWPALGVEAGVRRPVEYGHETQGLALCV